jgi:hypothetical protein
MIAATKPVHRKVLAARGTALVCSLTPEGIVYREPRKRTRFLIPHGVAYIAAVRLHVAAVKAERKARRMLKRAERGA